MMKNSILMILAIGCGGSYGPEEPDAETRCYGDCENGSSRTEGISCSLEPACLDATPDSCYVCLSDGSCSMQNGMCENCDYTYTCLQHFQDGCYSGSIRIGDNCNRMEECYPMPNGTACYF